MNATDKVAQEIEAAFPREVVKVPLYANAQFWYGANFEATPHYGLCLERPEKPSDWIKATCKKGYIPHTKQDVKDLCTAVAAGFDLPAEDINIDAHFIKGKGHAVAITPTKKYRRTIAGSDTIFPTLYVRAYYGGAFRAMVGMKRDVCSNLMMLRNVQQTTVSLRHCGNYRDNFDVTVEQFRELIAISENVVEAAKRLNQVKVEMKQFLQEVFPAQISDRAEKRQGRKIDAILTRLHKERLDLGSNVEGKEATLWEMINAVQGYCQHDKHRRSENRSYAGRAFAALNDIDVEAAYEYAFQLAS
jgi:hypothetical protein